MANYKENVLYKSRNKVSSDYGLLIGLVGHVRSKQYFYVSMNFLSSAN